MASRQCGSSGGRGTGSITRMGYSTRMPILAETERGRPACLSSAWPAVGARLWSPGLRRNPPAKGATTRVAPTATGAKGGWDASVHSADAPSPSNAVIRKPLQLFRPIHVAQIHQDGLFHHAPQALEVEGAKLLPF